MATSDVYRICVICSGNICRSPIAAVVLRDQLAEVGLADRVQVDSAGTGDWQVGNPADPRTLAVLSAHGYDGSDHRAAWFGPDQVGRHDLLLVADRGHLDRVTRATRAAGEEPDIRLLRSFDAEAVAAGTLEVDDPYYGADDGFARCLEEIERACRGVTVHLQHVL